MQTIFPPAPLCEPNPHGVFMDEAEHIIYQHKNTKASLRLARSTEGYHWGHHYWLPLSGECSGPVFTAPTRHNTKPKPPRWDISNQYSAAPTIAKTKPSKPKKALAAIDKLLNTHRQTALAQVLAEIAALEAQLKKAA